MLQIFIDATAYNSGQRRENIKQAHLVVAGGKLVLQKKDFFDTLLAVFNGMP